MGRVTKSVVDEWVGAWFVERKFDNRAIAWADRDRLETNLLVLGIAVDQHPVEDRADHMETRPRVRASVHDEDANRRVHFNGDRVVGILVCIAIEDTEVHGAVPDHLSVIGRHRAVVFDMEVKLTLDDAELLRW